MFECIGGTIYLAGRDVATGELIPDLLPCPMCRRMIINAGQLPWRNRAAR